MVSALSRPSPLLPPFLLLAALLSSPAAWAKELQRRPGVGFNNDVGDHSALSFRYGLPTNKPALNLLAEFNLGLTADGRDESENGFYVGGRALWSVVAEDNMNLYATVGFGAVTYGDGAGAAARLQPGLEAEFFFFGLENLGFSASWGLRLDLGDPLGATTFAAGPGMGLHYYF